MKIHNIPLKSLTAWGNKTVTSLVDGELNLTCPKPLDKNCGRAVIPQKFRLPFRINLTLKADATNFNILMGNGYVHFSHAPNESGNGMRRQDIFTGKEEFTKQDYYAELPLNEYINLSVVVGSKITWIEINGHCYYPTRKAQYINLLEKGDLPDDFTNGLEIAIGAGKIGVNKGTQLVIRSIEIIEYGSDEPDVPEEIANFPDLSPAEWRIRSLPHELRDTIKTDEHLAQYMKGSIELRKIIDEYGNVSIMLSSGVQYKLQEPEAGEQSKWIKNDRWKQDYTPDPIALNVIEAHKPSDYKIGTVLSFGRYYWRVLDIQNGAALIITEEIIEQRPYHDVYENITWADCTLRKYLNGEFHNSFNAADKARIIAVTNENPDNPWYGTDGGKDTQDRIFILSLEEAVCKYFGDSSANLYNRGEKQKYWFERKDANNSKRGTMFKGVQWTYWLRTPGRVNVKAVYCGGSGIGIQGNNVLKGNLSEGKCTVGVRPALWLRI